MRRNHILGFSIVSMIVLAALLPGCKSTAPPDLSYDPSASAPVIVYKETSAIPPQYNPDVPVVVIYGNGTVITKESPYRLTSAALQGSLDDLLKTIADEGFFGLEATYEGESLAGGTTATLIVNLRSGTYQVRVVDGSRPPASWSAIVGAVEGADAAGAVDYVPPQIRFFAGEAAEVPVGTEVVPWPADPSDLAEAAAGSANGILLTGNRAAAAWAAVQQGAELSAEQHQGDIFWSSGGKVFTYVYAHPELPGITDD